MGKSNNDRTRKYYSTDRDYYKRKAGKLAAAKGRQRESVQVRQVLPLIAMSFSQAS
jgi:hypothetical protein